MSTRWADRRLLVAAALGAVVVLVGVPLLSAREGSGPPGAAPLPPVEVETGVIHVHGLGVDPADGVLYAATHSGLFRIPDDGAAVRVANRAQDTMGFAVVGPGEFIGSGHPDFREDNVRPPLLGLIASDDRGESWQGLSLHGEADFHALHSDHGQVCGYDSTSQTFMVSRDRTSWDRRSSLAMADFVVSPADPDVVLAARLTYRGRGTRAADRRDRRRHATTSAATTPSSRAPAALRVPVPVWTTGAYSGRMADAVSPGVAGSQASNACPRLPRSSA